MSLFQQRNSFKKIIYSWVSLIFIIFIIFILLDQIYSFYYKNEKIKEKLGINEKKIEKLNQEFTKKTEQYNFLNTDRGQEEYYKDVYSYGKEGEKIIVLYNATDTTDQNEEQIVTRTDTWYEFKKRVQYFIDNYTNL